METVISLENVTCTFGAPENAVRALDDVTLRVMSASYVAVMGATGSGKSSLLNCESALERPTAGEVHLLGHDVTRMGERRVSHLRRDHVGFVFQSYNLFSG